MEEITARETRSIGDFGVDHNDFIDLTFGYFGEVIRVHPESGELTYLDFMSKAMEVNSENETEGVRLTMEFLQRQIHPDDWDMFWQLALKKRQKLNDLMQISKAIVEASAGFPTTQPSDSGPTPPTTAKKSRASSSRQAKSRAIEQAKPIDTVDSAMGQLTGRPDLQKAIYEAQGGLVGAGQREN
jgi:hypothetical protein